MNNQDNSNKLTKEEIDKKCLENTLSCFIFGILGVVIPVFIFSIISMHYAKLKKYDKLAKLHNVGDKLSQIGIVVSGLLIVAISLYYRFFK